MVDACAYPSFFLANSETSSIRILGDEGPKGGTLKDDSQGIPHQTLQTAVFYPDISLDHILDYTFLVVATPASPHFASTSRRSSPYLGGTLHGRRMAILIA